MLAHAQGQLFHAAPLAAGLGVSGHTVARYLDVLADLLLVRRLQPWAGNLKKPLVRSPKVYVRDSGLVHTLLGIRDHEELLGHPIVALSWEGFVLGNLVLLASPRHKAWFYRTREDGLSTQGENGFIWTLVPKPYPSPRPRNRISRGCSDDAGPGSCAAPFCLQVQKPPTGTTVVPDGWKPAIIHKSAVHQQRVSA
jgi:hypothetical protein